MQTDQGRCVNCGLLAQCNREPRKTVEAERYFRGEYAIPTQGNGFVCDVEPICYAGAFDIRGEFLSAAEIPGDGLHGHTRRRMAILNRADRNCTRWVRHIPGRSPSEHMEMIQSAYLDSLRREREETRRIEREQDKQWRAREDRLRRVEIFCVIIGAPMMAWLIPWLGNRLTQPAPPPVPTAAAPAEPGQK